MEGASDTLVLGFGNPLRGDDSAGCVVSDRIEALVNTNLDAVSAHQLLPEHAELIRRYRQVFFVDASADTSLKDLQIIPLTFQKERIGSLHANSPAFILNLCQSLYDVSPQAELIAIPARNFDFGEILSPETEKYVVQAIRYILNRVGLNSQL